MTDKTRNGHHDALNREEANRGRDDHEAAQRPMSEIPTLHVNKSGTKPPASQDVLPVFEQANAVDENFESAGKLLLVEPSSTMRFVLEKYLNSLGFETVALDDFRKAQSLLREQFDSFTETEEFDCVLIGWQSTRDADATKFLAVLESPDFHDLPAIVLSQEMRANCKAWVAGRSQTTLLRWKDYRQVKERLFSLLDNSLASDTENLHVKFSNHDIHILVVDDSASIRFALRDLLQLHGYKVTVVSSHIEALAVAREIRFDLAVLDYYLEDSNGDELCAELLADEAVGPITCAILTGTYSDHIIKSSLRSGAVECMFKNESSELLLARIDAISRLIRSRKSLYDSQHRLDRIIDELGGPVLVLDRHRQVVFVSEAGQRLLGYEGISESPLAKPASSLIGRDLLSSLTSEAYDGEVCEGVFVSASGSPMSLFAQSMPIDFVVQGQTQDQTQEQNSKLRTTETLILFSEKSVHDAIFDGDTDGLISARQSNIDMLGVDNLAGTSPDDPDNAAGLIQRLGVCIDSVQTGNPGSEYTSLLMVEIAHKDAESRLKPATSEPAKLEQLSEALRMAHPQPSDLAYFGSSRFGFILRYRDSAHALMQTRKVVQACNRIGEDLGLQQTSSIAVVVELQGIRGSSPEELTESLHRKLTEVSRQGRDVVMLLDHDRYLSVYPDN